MNLKKSNKFPSKARIKRSDEFARVKTSGRKGYSKHLLISFATSTQERSRLGLTVTKKISASAVIRNRFKRRIRDLFRKINSDFRKPVDLVVVARQDSTMLGFDELKAEFEGLLRREGVL